MTGLVMPLLSRMLVAFIAAVVVAAPPAAAQITVSAQNAGQAQFVPGFTAASPGTWAGLHASEPCGSGRLGQYAVIGDLYSASAMTNEVLRCTSSGAQFYWRPQRTDYVANMVSTGGSYTLSCGTSAPTVFVSGVLVSSMQVNLSTVRCWPGAQFTVANNLTLGLFGLTITGLAAGTVRSLGLNARGTFYFDGTAWQAY